MFVCACFGVVLEGPMGAVIFWTLLGMASGIEPDLAETLPTAEPSASPAGSLS
jgi:hypothetical protein